MPPPAASPAAGTPAAKPMITGKITSAKSGLIKKATAGASSTNGSASPTSTPAANARVGASAAGASTSLQIASPEVQPLLQDLYSAESEADCRKAGARLADFVFPAPSDDDAESESAAITPAADGWRALRTQGIENALKAAATNKKSAFEREAAAFGVEALAKRASLLSTRSSTTPFAADAWLLPAFLLSMLELYADKSSAVVDAATSAATALLSLSPREAASDALFAQGYGLCTVIQDGSAKWQAKVGALKLVARLSESATEQIGEALENLIPVLASAMQDTKAEVSKQATKAATKVCQNTLENKDLRPFIPDLVQCMARPDTVPECIKKLSNTTFVAEVTGPALAVMVPLLSRALNERSQTVQRSTVIVVENLCKLVLDPSQAAKFLPALTPGVERIEAGASFPEVREHAKSARETLHKATQELADRKDASAAAENDADLKKAVSSAVDTIVTTLAKKLVETPSAEAVFAQRVQIKADDWTMQGVEHVARMIARLAEKRILQASPWEQVYVAPYLATIIAATRPAAQAGQLSLDVTSSLRKAYEELDAARFGADEADEEDDPSLGEPLCNIKFSLAYGGLLLLNNTRLKLHKGRRYGIVATNGAGKSTLLKALRDGKVEGYPPQDVLKTTMVEHSLQGEDGSQEILQFVCKTPGLPEGTTEAQVEAALKEVGFSDERLHNPVGSLSGGWKMKLELARAMLLKSVVYLLDEPTNVSITLLSGVVRNTR